MKTICIGDIHGRSIWKQIIDQSFDKVIFIGDYFDSFDINGNNQLQNLLDIVEFKKQNLDKVILLIGNHDIHYLINERYSGYNHLFAPQFREVLIKYSDLFQICHIQNKYLFSHAGISKVWLKNWKINKIKDINELWKYNKHAFSFQIGSNFSSYGDDVTQSPVWIRPNSLINCKHKSFVDIIGHTATNQIDFEHKDQIIMIDTLAKGQYLIIENNDLKIGKINFQKSF